MTDLCFDVANKTNDSLLHRLGLCLLSDGGLRDIGDVVSDRLTRLT